ncbi:MAG: alpha/beta hydrolase [Thermosynechococcaceae cyanobacterium]
MPYITVRDIPHYYEWVVAESEPQNKPVMVFLHGWGGSARYWQSTAEALSPYFNCLLYDLRGFGRSQPPDPPTQISPQDCQTQFAIETYADDLAQLLQALKLGPVFINAHSTGSSMALFFLNRYPELAQKAILTCHGIFEYEAKSFSQFHQFGTYVVQFRPKWLYRLPGVDRLFMARFLHQPIPSAERKAFLEDFLMADYGAALGTMFSAVSEQASITMPQEFVKLKVPTLMVSGEYDQIIPAAMGQKAADLSDNVEFSVIPNTGHFPMLEDSERYLRRVSQFLELSE